MKAYKYVFPEHMLDNGKYNEENKCFCRHGELLWKYSDSFPYKSHPARTKRFNSSSSIRNDPSEILSQA